MVVLLIGRSAAAVAGALLVLAAWSSVIRTLIVPRRAKREAHAAGRTGVNGGQIIQLPPITGRVPS
jgi:hypothetical protein